MFADAVVKIYVNENEHENDTSATWKTGENDVVVYVNRGTTTKTYQVTVTKSGSLGALTVASVEGAEVGETTITVTETIGAGNTYKYKTAASVDLPTLDEDLSDWTDWDGEADIAAVDTEEIVIAEIDYKNRAKAAGKATVASLTE